MAWAVKRVGGRAGEGRVRTDWSVEFGRVRACVCVRCEWAGGWFQTFKHAFGGDGGTGLIR